MTKYDILRLVLNFFELTAFITGLLFFKKVKGTYWQWFVVYLGIIVAAELTSEYFLIVKKEPNQWIYIWFVIPLEYIFFIWLYYKYFQHSKFKHLPLLLCGLYVAAYITDMVYLRQLRFAFSSFSYLVGSMFLLVLIILYFFQLLSSNRVLGFRQSLMFWVSTGLLVFFLGSLPFYGLWNTLRFQYPDTFNLYWMVQMVFNSLMYIFFTFSFIWGNPK